MAKDRVHRSTLYVPGSNLRALEKTKTLEADCIIIDLEDSVGPGEKGIARENIRVHFQSLDAHLPRPVIRINAPSTNWFDEDIALCLHLNPSAILLPKVYSPADIENLEKLLNNENCDPDIKIWAMIETPRSVLSIADISNLGLGPSCRLQTLVVGTNDLAKDTGVALTPMREHMHPWLMQIVLAARFANLTVLDGVSNDFKDLDAFALQCRQSVAMGFDGRTLIHPAQIDVANRAFMPSPEEIIDAQAIVDAFNRPENQNKGAVSINGRMVERLHHDMAVRLLARTV